jgi:hypothetical protein
LITRSIYLSIKINEGKLILAQLSLLRAIRAINAVLLTLIKKDIFHFVCLSVKINCKEFYHRQYDKFKIGEQAAYVTSVTDGSLMINTRLIPIESMLYTTLIIEIMVTFDLTEFEIRQAASDFCKTRSARSRSFSSAIVTVGSRIISLIMNFPSICSSFPLDLQLKLENVNFEFSAIERNVVIRQLLTAAVNKCSGDHIPGIPFGNSGGVATSIQLPASLLSSGEHMMPLRSVFQFTSTL